MKFSAADNAIYSRLIFFLQEELPEPNSDTKLIYLLNKLSLFKDMLDYRF
jgi:hypothetical protein